jgi:choline dehydrogenase-like flavoprotein
MLSGVGPKEHLIEKGIPVIHDLPGVGQNLQDHIVINTRFRLKPGYSLQYALSQNGLDPLRALAALGRWKLFGTGPFTSNVRSLYVSCLVSPLLWSDIVIVDVAGGGGGVYAV